jgi:transposase
MHRGRPLDEQRQRRIAQGRPGRHRPAVRGHRQRRHRHQMFPDDAQRLPAGGQHPQPRRRAQQQPHQLRACLQHVLTVVEQQQQLTAAQELNQDLGDRPVGLVVEVQRLHHGVSDQLRSAHRRQVHLPHPVDEGPANIGGHPHRQASLARPTRPGQHHQPRRSQQPSDLRDLLTAAHETSQLGREATRARTLAGRGRRHSPPSSGELTRGAAPEVSNPTRYTICAQTLSQRQHWCGKAMTSRKPSQISPYGGPNDGPRRCPAPPPRRPACPVTPTDPVSRGSASMGLMVWGLGRYLTNGSGTCLTLVQPPVTVEAVREDADPSWRVEHRYRAVLEVLAGESVTAVAAKYGASRQSIYAWVERYRDEGLIGLQDRSRRPVSSPQRISAELETLICELRRASPRWGAQRIVHELGRRQAPSVPSRSTVYGRWYATTSWSRRSGTTSTGTSDGSGTRRCSCDRWTGPRARRRRRWRGLGYCICCGSAGWGGVSSARFDSAGDSGGRPPRARPNVFGSGVDVGVVVDAAGEQSGRTEREVALFG